MRRIHSFFKKKAGSSVACDLNSHLLLLQKLINDLHLSSQASPSFTQLFRQEISRKSKLLSESTAANYRAAYNSFTLFLDGQQASCYQIDTDMMERYQAWLSSRGIANNSISFYMRILRCVYHHAVKQGLTPDRHPFQNVYTGIDKTRKRAISLKDIKKIKNLDLRDHPGLERARDLFILSFYCIGISFVDLAKLRKSNIVNGHLIYKRAKTGQAINLALTPTTLSLFRKYASALHSPYLLDIISDPGGDIRRQYRTELNNINRHLKKVGILAGISSTLTTYVSRHSWASIAMHKNVKISTISQALGHENENTTRIYLAKIDTGHIDKANALIMRDL